MSAFWQRIFLTIGILIAVFGMRLVFPLLIVGVTADLNPIEAVTLALEQRPESDPTSYAHLLNEAYPQIAAFGGMFLLTVLEHPVEEQHEQEHAAERGDLRVGLVEQVRVAGGVVLGAPFQRQRDGLDRVEVRRPPRRSGPGTRAACRTRRSGCPGQEAAARTGPSVQTVAFTTALSNDSDTSMMPSTAQRMSPSHPPYRSATTSDTAVTA